ncbi:kinetochore protein Spc25 [Clupea harengus]|uniref:Kinetochore protein SPC25 n=1 Tax=Clupea harengus TaxID=7950 RepID=A0A6P8EEP2_CLUHA|nr:kinetochore protein Spc25 [Clupea harengus]
MAQINDVDSGESFITMLEEIRTKLIFQVVGEMVETETELHHAHRQFGKAGLETCLKKCKDETLFETIEVFKKDLAQRSTIVKQKSRELPEVISEIEEKSLMKESLIQKIERLKTEQAKNSDLIVAQNKANKDRLKNLHKVKQVFQDCLKLEIRKIQGEKLQFVFRNLDHRDPESAYTFILMINDEGVYQIESCSPPLECMSQLEQNLKKTNNFSAFLANVRKEFKALIPDK